LVTGQTIAAPVFQSGDVTAKAFQIDGGFLRGRHTTWEQYTSLLKEIVLLPFDSCTGGLPRDSGPGATSWTRGFNYQWLTAAKDAASKYFERFGQVMACSMPYRSGIDTLAPYQPSWSVSWKGDSL
jgi:hypothetical protein